MDGDIETAWTVEVLINQERVFGQYSDGNILLKDEPATLARVRERLAEALTYLDERAKSLRTVGQTVS